MEDSSPQEESWENLLQPEFCDVPLRALRYSCCHRLACHLDDKDVLMCNDMVPNFGGLAELVGFDGIEINQMERAQSPTKQLLECWMNRSDPRPTIGKLIEYLAKLGRFDTLTDCYSLIKKDAILFLEKPHKFEKEAAPIQDETVTQGPGCEEIPTHITRHDVMNGCETYYDAFVCFNPYGDSERDLKFIRELIQRFEKHPYNFKLFVPFRDDLAGLNAHSISAKIISERCRHMIVVLSPNFLASQACEFQSTFAHALSPGARNKRIVPIKIQECPTPNILRIMACCDFTKSDLRDWSWERLAKSIMVQLSPEDFHWKDSSSQNGLLHSSSNSSEIRSALESGLGSMPSSHASSRSASPASTSSGSIRSFSQPIIARQPLERMELCQSAPAPYHTAPVTTRSSSPADKKPSSSPGFPFRNLFKKPRN